MVVPGLSLIILLTINSFVAAFCFIDVYYGDERGKSIYSFNDKPIYGLVMDKKPYLSGYLMYFSEAPDVCTTPPSAPSRQHKLPWILLSRWDNEFNPSWWDKCNIEVRTELAKRSGYAGLLLQDIRSNWTNGNTYKTTDLSNGVYTSIVPDNVGTILLQKYTGSDSYAVVITLNAGYSIFYYIFEVAKYIGIGILGLLLIWFINSTRIICYKKVKRWRNERDPLIINVVRNTPGSL